MKSEYFSLHHRFLAWVGRLTHTIIVCPHPVAIGNASEDYYFGLLKARNEGKKLVILFPFDMPGRFKIRMFEPAILFLESDLLAVKFRGVISSVLSGLFTLYFMTVRVAIILIHKFRPYQPPGYYYRPLAGQDLLWRPDPKQLSFDWDLARKQGWDKQLSVPIKLSLPVKLVAACEGVRDRMGLPRNAWFVCLHVREGGYSGDWNNIRNADITRYLGAIKEITKRGGWVVRMGDPSMSELPALEQVIDYAHFRGRSARMDVYLMKECSFYVGTSSGITDTAFLLGKPVVLTNMTSWINLLPQKPGDLIIFKHIYSRAESRFISLQEWLLRGSMITPDNWSSPGWQLVENTEDEITSVVLEKLDLPGKSDPTYLQHEFKKTHLNAVQELSKTLRFGSAEIENCNDWFRMASRMLTWRGAVSTAFLEKNWHKNSQNA